MHKAEVGDDMAESGGRKAPLANCGGQGRVGTGSTDPETSKEQSVTCVPCVPQLGFGAYPEQPKGGLSAVGSVSAK